MQNFDLIVIGSGAALIVLEAALAQGKKCALVERHKMGGTCLNRGCIPSKILVHPADMIRESERGEKIGLKVQPPEVDWDVLTRRMWTKIDENKAILKTYLEIPGLTVFQGTAYFTEPYVLNVSAGENQPETTITARQIIIGVGGRARKPDIPGLAEAGYLTFESFFGDKFPSCPFKRLLIIGGGIIGAEFAHIFSAFGSEITIMDHNPHLVKYEEPEISTMLEQEFSRVGIRVRTNGEPVKVEHDREGKKVTVRDRLTGQEEIYTCDEIFVAAGFVSNSDILRADRCGLAMDAKGYIITDEYLRTNVPGIYAVGDINGKFQYRHKANYEAYIVANNLYEPEKPQRIAYYDRVPWAIFTHPQIAHVGMTEREASAAGYELLTGVNYYSATAKGYAMGYLPGDQDDGFVKLVVSKDHTILGVHIIGPQAAILIQPFIYLMNKGLNAQIEDINPCETSVLAHDPGHEMLRPHVFIKPDSTAAIDQAMVIHPALSEVAAWATGYLKPVPRETLANES